MRPALKLTGTDGNVFAVIALAVKAAKEVGLDHKALRSACLACQSYGDVLALVQEWFDVE